MKKYFFAIYLMAFIACLSYGQVAVNTSGNSADNSAMLDVSSSNSGILIPRMTTNERDQIVNPAEGLIIFNMTSNAVNYYTGQVWYTINGMNLCSPEVTLEPVNEVSCPGDDVSFQTSAKGDGLIYRWQENQGGGFIDLSNGGVYNGVSSNILQLNNIPLSMDDFQYRCIIEGSCPPNDTANSVTLDVYAPLQITGNPSNATECEMMTALFMVSCTGTNLNYQWQEDNGSGFSNCYYSGYNSSTLNVDAYAYMNGFAYRCVITDHCSNTATSSSASLTVLPMLMITSQPSNQTVLAGNTATFSVSASGTIAYQWEVNSGSGYSPISNGINYSGVNTPTLTINNTPLSMDGNFYRCIIYGDCPPFDEASLPARLTVN